MSYTVPKRIIALYALPNAAYSVPTIPIAVYLPSFYAQSMGLGLAVTGLLLGLARAFDVLSDPVVGYLSDRSTGRFGRRKPFIAAGALLSALGLFALLAPPQGIGPVYLAVWAIVLYLGWTCINIPYSAWGAELSDDYDERTRITAAREGLGVMGVLAAAGMPFLLGMLGYASGERLLGLAVMTVALGAPATILLLRYVPERKATVIGSASGFGLSGVTAIFANRSFRRLITAWFMNGLANGLPATLLPLFLQYRLGVNDTQRDGLVLLYFAAAVLTLPFWLWLARRGSKDRAWRLAMVGACCAFITVPFMADGDIFAFAIVCIITGFALGADLSLPPAMQADVVDVDRLMTGKERAGLFFAAWSMTTKLSMTAPVALAFPLLGALGLEGDAPSPTALMALVALYAVVPVALKLGAVALMARYPLSRHRQAVLRQRLERRRLRTPTS